MQPLDWTKIKQNKEKPLSIKIILFGFLTYFASYFIIMIIASVLGYNTKDSDYLFSVISTLLTLLWLVYYIEFRTCLTFTALGLGLKIKKKYLYIAFMCGVLVYFLGYLLDSLYTSINLHPLTTLTSDIYFSKQIKSGIGIIFIAIDALIITPIFEEFFFRSIMYTVLRQLYSRGIAICATSILFAIGHIEPIYYPIYILTSLVFIYIYERSGKLLPCIIAHSTMNLLGFLQLLINNSLLF